MLNRWPENWKEHGKCHPSSELGGSEETDSISREQWSRVLFLCFIFICFIFSYFNSKGRWFGVWIHAVAIKESFYNNEQICLFYFFGFCLLLLCRFLSSTFSVFLRMRASSQYYALLLIPFISGHRGRLIPRYGILISISHLWLNIGYIVENKRRRGAHLRVPSTDGYSPIQSRRLCLKRQLNGNVPRLALETRRGNIDARFARVHNGKRSLRSTLSK